MQPKTNALVVVNPGDQYKALSLEEAGKLAGAMVSAGMFPDLDSANTAYIKILAGQEMGIPPFQAMTGIHIIKGRASLAANLMATKVMQSGKYRYRTKQLDDKMCILDFQELEGSKWTVIGTSTFNVEDATRAGTQNMGKFPRNMLFARALSNGVKWYCPDIFGGTPVYVEGEIENEVPPEPTDEERQRTEDRRREASMAGQSKAAKEAAKPKPETPAVESSDTDDKSADAGENDSAPLTPPPPAETVVAAPIAEAESAEDVPHTAADRRRIFAILGNMGFSKDDEKKKVYSGLTGKASMKDLSHAEAMDLIEKLESADADTLRWAYVDSEDISNEG